MATKRGQGEGSVFQRHARDCPKKSGNKTCVCPWYAQIDHGFVGGRRVRPVRAATRDDGKRPVKADALRTLDEMRQEKRAGVVSSAATLTTWLTYWLDNIVGPSDLKPSTRVYYETYVTQWLVPQLGKIQLAKLGPEHIRGMHASMRRAGKSPTTIRNAHATLRKALGAALTERRVAYNWAKEVSAPAAADNPHDQLTIDQAGNVFVVASRDPRELARAHVAILCGLRQGEALALRWEDVRGDLIHVGWSAARVGGERIRQRPKTKRSVREVPIPPAAQHSLRAWREGSGGRGFVFHGHAGVEAIEDASRDHRVWRAILADADVPTVPLHGARGTCATMLSAQGYPLRLIADILGQADIRVTAEHYERSDQWQRTEALRQVGAAFELE